MRKKVLTFIGFTFIIGLIFLAYLIVHQHNKSTVKKNTPVEISFLQLKNDADCILINQGSLNVIIDTGESHDFKKINSYLKQKNVKDIEYLILTHPDKDHIGSAYEILENYNVKNIITPHYQKENVELKKINKKANDKRIPIIYPNVSRKFTVGEMIFVVYPPLEKHYEKDNNYSLVTQVKHKENKMMFTGDAEKNRLEELMMLNWSDIKLLKVPHHGRYNANSQKFLEVISPKYAVITSTNADDTIKETLKKQNTQIFYTGDGDKVFYSDGKNLTYKKE